MNKAYILIVLLAFNYPLLAQSHFRYQDREVLLKPEGTFYVIHTDNLSTESQINKLQKLQLNGKINSYRGLTEHLFLIDGLQPELEEF